MNHMVKDRRANWAESEALFCAIREFKSFTDTSSRDPRPSRLLWSTFTQKVHSQYTLTRFQTKFWDKGQRFNTNIQSFRLKIQASEQKRQGKIRLFCLFSNTFFTTCFVFYFDMFEKNMFEKTQNMKKKSQTTKEKIRFCRIVVIRNNVILQQFCLQPNLSSMIILKKKIVLVAKITQNCPVRQINLTLQVL